MLRSSKARLICCYLMRIWNQRTANHYLLAQTSHLNTLTDQSLLMRAPSKKQKFNRYGSLSLSNTDSQNNAHLKNLCLLVKGAFIPALHLLPQSLLITTKNSTIFTSTIPENIQIKVCYFNYDQTYLWPYCPSWAPTSSTDLHVASDPKSDGSGIFYIFMASSFLTFLVL